jgi:hypothetical protein
VVSSQGYQLKSASPLRSGGLIIGQAAPPDYLFYHHGNLIFRLHTASNRLLFIDLERPARFLHVPAAAFGTRIANTRKRKLGAAKTTGELSKAVAGNTNWGKSTELHFQA